MCLHIQKAAYEHLSNLLKLSPTRLKLGFLKNVS